MKILVTGSSGFVGTTLLPSLKNKGHDVIQFKRNSDYSQLKNIDIIIHLAGLAHITKKLDPSEYDKANFELTKNLVNAASKYNVSRFIFLSTIKVMGEEKTLGYSIDDTPRPITPYGKTKLKAENYLIENSKEMKWIILRPPLIYGQGVKANFKNLIKLVKLGIPIPIKNITNKRSYIYLENLVDLIEQCLCHDKFDNQIFFAIDSPPISTANLMDALSLLVRKKGISCRFPFNVLKISFNTIGASSIYQKFAGDMWVKDNAELEKRWSPSYTFEEGLRKTIASE